MRRLFLWERFVEAMKEDLNQEHSHDESGDEAQSVDVGDEQQGDDHDDGEGNAVVGADEPAVAAVVGRNSVDACAGGHEESDGELDEPLQTARDQQDCRRDRHENSPSCPSVLRQESVEDMS